MESVRDIIDNYVHIGIRFHNLKVQNNESNMAKRNNKNKQIWMKFGTRKFLQSPMLKLEMHKYRKILIR